MKQKAAYSPHRDHYLFIDEYVGIIMAKQKSSMPQSGAGLVNYYDEYKEAIQIPPQAIMAVCVGIIVISVFVRIFFI